MEIGTLVLKQIQIKRKIKLIFKVFRTFVIYNKFMKRIFLINPNAVKQSTFFDLRQHSLFVNSLKSCSKYHSLIITYINFEELKALILQKNKIRKKHNFPQIEFIILYLRSLTLYIE